MDMAGFLVSMRNLAHVRFLEGGGGHDGSVTSMTPEQIRELGKHKIKDLRDAVRVELTTSVLTLIDKEDAVQVVDKALREDEVLCIYYDRLPKLRGCFERSVSQSVSQ